MSEIGIYSEMPKAADITASHGHDHLSIKTFRSIEKQPKQQSLGRRLWHRCGRSSRLTLFSFHLGRSSRLFLLFFPRITPPGCAWPLGENRLFFSSRSRSSIEGLSVIYSCTTRETGQKVSGTCKTQAKKQGNQAPT